MKKLTLSAEPEVIEAARRLAELHGTSVSAMFSRFVRVLERREQQRPEIGALAREASGLIQWPAGLSEREVLEDTLLEKHAP